MPRFNKTNLEQLRNFLYNNYVHDSKIEHISYDCQEDVIKVELINPIVNVKIILMFHNVEISLAIKGNEYGSYETLISLTVEADYSSLQPYIPKYSGCVDNALYLMFQTFSGNELHIVSEEIIVEVS